MFFFWFSFMNPLYDPILVFPKFDPLTASGSVADPDPGLGAFLTPGSGMGESQHPDPGSVIRNEQAGSYFLKLRNHFFAFLGVKILKFFDEDP